jgi:hypothetical protein
VTLRDSDTRIRRAFEAAFQRFCEADTFEGQEDELSNMSTTCFDSWKPEGG